MTYGRYNLALRKNLQFYVIAPNEHISGINYNLSIFNKEKENT